MSALLIIDLLVIGWDALSVGADSISAHPQRQTRVSARHGWMGRFDRVKRLGKVHRVGWAIAHQNTQHAFIAFNASYHQEGGLLPTLHDKQSDKV